MLVLSCCGSIIVFWFVYNTDFCYFDAFYFLKLPQKAMVFMYPCTCMLVSTYYVILQKSSSTHIYHSRRSTRDEWTPQCSYSLLVGPRGEVRVVSLMVNGYADIYKDNRRNHLRHKGEEIMARARFLPRADVS